MVSNCRSARGEYGLINKNILFDSMGSLIFNCIKIWFGVVVVSKKKSLLPTLIHALSKIAYLVSRMNFGKECLIELHMRHVVGCR